MLDEIQTLQKWRTLLLIIQFTVGADPEFRKDGALY